MKKLLKLRRLRKKLREEVDLLDATMLYVVQRGYVPFWQLQRVRVLNHERNCTRKALVKLLRLHPYF